MQSFTHLGVWRRAHALVLRVYVTSKDLPQSENFGLILNLRRSAVNIARSIAEGSGRSSDAEFAPELKKARASAHELEYLLLLARDLAYVGDSLHEELSTEVIEIRKMLSGLIKRVTDGS